MKSHSIQTKIEYSYQYQPQMQKTALQSDNKSISWLFYKQTERKE